jgi:two-component sensor histidine kinase
MTSPRQTLVLPERTLWRRLVGAVLVSNLVILGLVAFVLGESRTREDDQRAALSRNIAAVLNANLSGIIAKVDIALLSVTDEAERQLASGPIDKPRLDEFIVRTQSRLPEIESFRAANAEGLAVYGAEVTVANTKSLAHRDYFKTLRDHPSRTLVFSDPLVGGITGKWMVLFVRRISHPDGTFGGLAYAGVTLEYLTRSFASFDVGRSGAITLRDASLALIDRFPSVGPPGQDVGKKDAPAELSALVGRGQVSGTFGTEDTTTFVRCGDAPFYLEVRLAGQDSLGPWYNLVAALAVAAVTFLVATLVFAVMYFRNARRNRTAAQALVDRDDQIESLLVEKEVILSEVHHRIKNNMATIAGLLTIQSSLDEGGPAENILQTASNRIRSMAVLYEKLFLSNNKQQVSMKEYFSTLLGEILETFPNSGLVTLRLTLDDAVLTAHMASPLGILLNELMTNSMKHAFPEGTKGTISVASSVEAGRLQLEYRDDGVGFSEATEAANPSGFGRRLIGMMVRQLKGTQSRLSGQGAGWKFEFPLEVAPGSPKL